MRLDVKQIAVEYYFGDLQYWKLPKVALEALEEGYDGAALSRLAGLANRNANEIREGDLKADEVDSAFREMGVDAPISKDQARLALATESAYRAINGASGVFDTARYIYIRRCETSFSFTDPVR